jgi:hypothetical protein
MIREKDFLRKQASPSQGSEGVLGGEKSQASESTKERVFPQKSHKYFKTQKGVHMAYIEKERVAEIRVELKKIFPQFKFSVTREHSTTIVLKVLKGDIDFFDDAMRLDGINHFGDSMKLDRYVKERRHTGINEFCIESNWRGEALAMLLQVKEIVCKGHFDRNAGDMGADYPGWNFHVRISVGSYDKPYELIFTAAIAA